jgi:hypothetical protein
MNDDKYRTFHPKPTESKGSELCLAIRFSLDILRSILRFAIIDFLAKMCISFLGYIMCSGRSVSPTDGDDYPRFGSIRTKLFF